MIIFEEQFFCKMGMQARIKQLLKKIDKTDISGIKNLMLKPINMIVAILYTPLLLSYLGAESYGLWSTVLTVINWINYFDLGIGLGLRNLLTKELTAKDFENAKKSVSTAYVILASISFVILFVLIILVFFLDWFTVFNTEIDMRIPLFITFVFLCVNFVLALCNQLFYALHLSERVALRSTLVQVVNYVGVFVLSKTTEPSFIYMAILFGLSTSVIHIANMTGIFSKYKYLRPNIKFFDKKKITQITNVGFAFFAIQLAGLLLNSVDHILITNLFGPEKIPPIDVSNRIFSLGSTFVGALMVPYLSRTTEALENGNFAWIRQAIKKIYIVFCLVLVVYIVVFIFFRPLVGLYLTLGGKNVEVEFSDGIILTMFLYNVLHSFVIVNTPFINGTGKLKFQLIVSVTSGILSIPLAIFFGVNCALGAVGVKLAAVILMGAGAILYPINLHCILKKEERMFILKQTSTGCNQNEDQGGE